MRCLLRLRILVAAEIAHVACHKEVIGPRVQSEQLSLQKQSISSGAGLEDADFDSGVGHGRY